MPVFQEIMTGKKNLGGVCLVRVIQIIENRIKILKLKK